MISLQHKGKIISDERKLFLSKSMKGDGNPMFGKRGEKSPMFGRKWINNGIESKFINIENGLPLGFKIGRIYKNKIYDKKG